ncbi:MAG: diguanylate cyclase [Dehalococcoidia bacterium]|nr:diguanylate cyclase [Dehalococcoidia bacterium]
MSEYMREIWIRVVMLAVWLALAVGGVVVLDPERDTAALAAALIAASAGLSILRPFGASHLLFAALAAAAYAAVQGLRAVADGAEPDAPYVPAAAAGAFAIVITAIAGDLLRNALLAYDAELHARARVIEEIEAVDPVTGATKRAHADRLLNDEVERARRYGRPFTLLMIGPDAWAEHVQRVGPAQAERVVAELAQHLLARLRAVDTLIHMEDARFAALLPETGLEGAQVVAEKIVTVGEELLGLEVRTGIASFPDDEVTAAGLMREAEEALAFASIASIRVASRNLLT